jgi:hypothetical protein
MSYPLSVLPDPWDRMIVATALHLSVPLVTKDRAITATGVVETIWWGHARHPVRGARGPLPLGQPAEILHQLRAFCGGEVGE